MKDVIAWTRAEGKGLSLREERVKCGECEFKYFCKERITEICRPKSWILNPMKGNNKNMKYRDKNSTYYVYT